MTLSVRSPVLLFFSLAATLTALAGDASLATAAPMGWNSWDAYGQCVTEAQFGANARFMAKNLKRFGWRYVVVDSSTHTASSRRGDRGVAAEA